MSHAPELHVMTFNLRCASGERPEHAWPLRRPVVRELLHREHPDLLGTQEGLPEQLHDIASDLPAYYDSLGEGREGGGRGEAMQVFFDTRRLQPRDHGHYWLSDTPDVPGSQSWGGDWPRMVTWVRFRDRRTGTALHLLNTHLEAFDATARLRSAELIRLRTGSAREPGGVVLVTGDFNEPAGEGGAVYDALVTEGPFTDTWETAEHRGPDLGTFHDYDPPTPGGDRIDWILATPDVQVHTAAANRFAVADRFPSDHLPVQIRVSTPPRPPAGASQPSPDHG